MRTYKRSIQVLAIVFGFCLGCDDPALQFATPKRPPAAESIQWFNRAAVLVDRLISEAEARKSPESPGIWNERGLATLLADLRGSDSDRKLALKTLSLPPRTRPVIASEQWWEFQQVAQRAEVLAIVEDPSAAEAIRKAEALAKTTEAAMGGIMEANDLLAPLRARVDDPRKAWADASDVGRKLILSTLHDIGDYATRDALFEERYGNISANGPEVISAVRTQVIWGNVANADEISRRFPGTMMGLRARAFMANTYASKGDQLRSEEAVGGMYAEYRKVPDDRLEEALFLILRTAGEAGSAKVFGEAFADWKKIATRNSRNDTADSWGYLGNHAATVRCNAEMKYCLERAEAAFARLEDAEKLAEAKLLIAAVFARSGDASAAQRWFDDSLATQKLDDYGMSEGFSRFVKAHIDTGQVPEALQIAEKFLKDAADFRGVYEGAARRLQRNGDYAEAFRILAKLPDSQRHSRIRVGREIALELVDARRETEAISLVETLPDQDQAAIFLCVAAARTGKPSYGSLQLLTWPEY